MGATPMNEAALREEICAVGQRMYEQHLIAASDGNVSVRLGHDRYLVTPSGVSKGFMTPESLVIANGRGEKVAGDAKVTSEFFTHLAAYEERPDIHAVVHAHPITATALPLMGISLEAPILPEVVVGLGGIPTAAYATPGTKEGADVLRPHIARCDAILLYRHGAVTAGANLLDAYHKLEKLEHAAQVLHLLYQHGTPTHLEDAQIRKLIACRTPYGATGKFLPIPGIEDRG